MRSFWSAPKAGLGPRVVPGGHLADAEVSRLNRLRPITKGFVAANIEAGEVNPAEMKAQIEVLRKMLLAMVEDIRVVLLRLASRTQTLRFYAGRQDDLRIQVARETLELYSPLANRLGVWELKWELEDLSFRYLHPEIYKKIAGMLDEKRREREQFIADAVAKVREELAVSWIRPSVAPSSASHFARAALETSVRSASVKALPALRTKVFLSICR